MENGIQIDVPGMCDSWKGVFRESRKGAFGKKHGLTRNFASSERPRCQQRRLMISEVSEEVSKEGRGKCARCTLLAQCPGVRGQCSLFQDPEDSEG